MFIIMHIYVRMVFRKDIKNITFDYEKYETFATMNLYSISFY